MRLPRIGPDIGYALRSMRRNPGFTAVVALSIGLGIAANSTVFSIVNAVLLGDLAVREPENLVVLVRDRDFTMSYPDYEDFRDSGAFEGLSARFPLVPVSLAAGGTPERVWGQVVTAGFFDVIGVRMAQGRGFLPTEDEVPDRDAVVVLGYGLWNRRFGGDPSIVGRTVILNQRHFTVVGIAQQGFRGTDRMLNTEFWVPLRMAGILINEMSDQRRYRQRDHSWLFLEGRLKEGVSKQQALAIVQSVAARVDKEHRRERPRKMSLDPAGKWPGQAGVVLRTLLGGLMVVVALVLTIACANVANLLLAKASARRKEFSLRLAIGANRGQLIQQLLTESILLSLFGAVIGWVIAFAATQVLSQITLPLPLPVEFDFSPDLRVVLFTAALALLTGILFGLAPALRASNPDLSTAMREGGTRFKRTRWFSLRNALVVVQVTLSLVLLSAGTLFLRSLGNATSIDLGIQPQGILSMSFDPNQHSPLIERRREFLAQLQRRVESRPGVESSAYVDVLPLSIGGSRSTTHPDHSAQLRADPTYFQASRGYLNTMGVALLRGSDFGRVSTGPQQALIDDVLAQRLFPGIDPLGRKIRASGAEYEVIGVAREAKARTIGESSAGVVYTNLDQSLDKISSIVGITLVVKTRARAATLLPAVRNEIASLDPNLAVFRTETMEDHVAKAFVLPQVAAQMFGVFGTVGLTLAAIGLFGVLSFTVRQRIREIGIRMALGAERAQVLRMVIREGLTLVAAGLCLGLPMALGMARLMSSLLYGLSPSDWVTFTLVPLAMLLIGGIAAWVPSRTASRVDPIIALRHE
jgi:predicted permease